jgi:pimeloyl-ACP methyl ester carboxylesterase
MQGKLRKISGQAAGAVLALIGGLFMFAALQRQLIYFPETAPEQALLTTAERSGLQPWRDRHGQLIGWRAHPPDEPQRRLVVFHGNAGHALYRQYFAAGFLALSAGWQVYLFEYPGYGARPGSPSEPVIKSAAVDAVNELLTENTRPVYLLGESLGSGVAAYLASKLGPQIAGLLLVTPFTSLVDVAGHHYGAVPAKALLRERYDAKAALDEYHGPVAFLVAGDDEIVPAALGRELFHGYHGPRLLREQPAAGHNSLDFNPAASWWREVTDFWLSRR